MSSERSPSALVRNFSLLRKVDRHALLWTATATIAIGILLFSVRYLLNPFMENIKPALSQGIAMPHTIDSLPFTIALPGDYLLASNLESTGSGGNDVLVNIQGAQGSKFNDTLIGDDSVNLLSGSKGDDILYGGAGDDYIFGDDHNDMLYGGAGADLLDGGSSGSDRLSGGTGGDVFVLRTGYGRSIIIDFVGGYGIVDRLDFRGVFSTFDQVLSVSSQVNNDVVISYAEGDSVTLIDFYLGNFGSDDVIVETNQCDVTLTC